MNRNFNGLLKIGVEYYAPTGIFALLSMLSYFITIDQVPGRMGMLVTFYLITINTHGSLEAPKSRGFSYIEIWFAGVQFQIVTAMLEYGCILAMRKYLFPVKDSSFTIFGKTVFIDSLIRKLDVIAFTFALVTFVMFNIVYWYSSF